MSSPSFIACKIYLTPTEQIRRIRVQAPPNTSFSDFQTAVSQLYAYYPQYQQQEQYFTYITYLDEENDWVTVSSESEWQGALARQAQLLNESGQTSEQLLKIKCQMMLKPTFQTAASSSSIGSQYEQQQRKIQDPVIDALSSTARTLVDKETWKPLIEQVKKGGTKVQPYVEQAKDKTVETAKKVQDWVTDPVKRQATKQWIQKMSEEGGTMAHDMFNEMYKEFESMILSQIAQIIISGGTSNSGSSSSSSSDSDDNNTNVEQEQSNTAEEQEQEEYSPTYEHLLLIDNDHLIDTDSEEEEEEEEQEEQEEEEFIIVQNEVPQALVQEEQSASSPSSFVHDQIEEPVQPFLSADDSFIVMDESQEEEQVQGNEEHFGKVKILQEMGFSNAGLNLQLLNEKNGDIVAVVAELLATTL